MKNIIAAMAVGTLFFSASYAVADDAIKIGVSTPITGPVAYGSEQEQRGIRTAVDEINANGGVLGKQITLVVEDNQCNPSVAVTATNKLIEENVVAVLGYQCSSAVLAAMPLLKEAGVPLVSGIASNPQISDLSGVGGNPWVFRLNPSDRELASANVNYLVSKGGVKKIAIVAESTDYGRGGTEAFAKAAKAKGLEVISEDFHQIGNPDFTTVIARLQRNGADAVALYHSHADTANFVKQSRAQGLDVILTGKMNFTGEAVEELVSSGAFDRAVTAYPYSAEIDVPANRAFVEKITAKFGEGPTYETFAGYEATKILAQAIEAAGSTDAEAIRAALEDTDYDSMIGGKIQFDQNNQAHNNAAVVTVKDGVVTVEDVFATN